MIGTGLAKVIAGWFVVISSHETFYMLQFWAGGIINMFIPSGGGQWAAQGPITMEAARMMGDRCDPVGHDGGLGRPVDQYDPALLGPCLFWVLPDFRPGTSWGTRR